MRKFVISEVTTYVINKIARAVQLHKLVEIDSKEAKSVYVLAYPSKEICLYARISF